MKVTLNGSRTDAPLKQGDIVFYPTSPNWLFLLGKKRESDSRFDYYDLQNHTIVENGNFARHKRYTGTVALENN